MQARTLAQFLATAYAARRNCERDGNAEWFDKWEDRIERACELLPSGSGFDSGTTCDGLQSVDVVFVRPPRLLRAGGPPPRLVFRTSYHHMSDHGFYVGWSEWMVTVTPDWHGVNVRVWLQSDLPVLDEHDPEGTEEYIGDVFAHVLATLVDSEGNRAE